jgi:hypothetical protein
MIAVALRAASKVAYVRWLEPFSSRRLPTGWNAGFAGRDVMEGEVSLGAAFAGGRG